MRAVTVVGSLSTPRVQRRHRASVRYVVRKAENPRAVGFFPLLPGKQTPWRPELCGVRLWTPGEPATGLQPRCSEHVYGGTGKEERKASWGSAGRPGIQRPLHEAKASTFRGGERTTWRVQQTRGPVSQAVVTGSGKGLGFPAGPREAASAGGGRALQELPACWRAWIPGTANSIWPSLSASFLGKRMSFLLGGAWERPALC